MKPRRAVRCFAGSNRCTAKGSKVSKRIEGQEITVVNRPDARYCKTPVNAERHPADAHCRAELSKLTAPCDQSRDRSRLMILQPGKHGQILSRIERDQVDSATFHQC